MEPEQGRRSVDDELVERAQHPAAGVLTVDVVDDELRDERVVEVRDLVTVSNPGVHAHPDPRRLAVGGDPPWRWKKPAADVLGVDAALDGVPPHDDVVLRERERLAGGDVDLLAHDVDARDGLRDRVLDLDACVHLEEEVLAVSCQEPLDGSRGAVRHGSCGIDGQRADARSKLGVDGRGRRLLDELLMSTLDRAVALAEMDDVAVAVGEDLHLDVPRVVQVALDVHGGVREVRLALTLGGLQRAFRLVGRARDAQSPSRRRRPTP